MKIIKSILAIMIAAALSLSAAACGGTKTIDLPAPPPGEAVADPPVTAAPTQAPTETPTAAPVAETDPPVTETEPPVDIDDTGAEPAVDPASSAGVLAAVLEAANGFLGEDESMPPTFTADVTADTCQNVIGLSPEEFTAYIEDATTATAMIMTIPHEIALLRVKDGNAAAVADLVAAGFNPMKWICVRPEVCSVVAADGYVLLVVAREAASEAAIKAFGDVASGVGTPNEFFNKDTEAAEGGPQIEGGGGLLILP